MPPEPAPQPPTVWTIQALLKWTADYLRTKVERMGHTITHQGRVLDVAEGVPAPFTEGPFGP